MDEKTMLVRIPGGDVVRREIAYQQTFRNGLGRSFGSHPEPVVQDDEMPVWFLGDPVPAIVKIK